VSSLRSPELWLVRHGETEWSASGRHTGTTDIELSEAGCRHAGTLRPRLEGQEFVRVLTSPLKRARVTCELAGFGDRAEVVPDLVEWDYGEDEGRTTPEIREDRPGWTVWSHGPRGGETAAEVGRRADAVIALAREADGPVIAFGHGHMCRVIGARWIGLPPEEGVRLKLSTAAISVLGHDRETPAVVRWNDTGHVRPE
jgi:broad specificity phosphatase PhoE